MILTRLWVYDPHYLKRERVAIDYWGLALLAIGAGSLQLMLDKGQEEDWFDSRLIVTMAIAAADRDRGVLLARAAGARIRFSICTSSAIERSRSASC